MVNKDVIKKIIVEFQTMIPKIRIISRDEIKTDPKLRYVFVGLRRAGKTYLMYHDIQRRLKFEGLDIQQVVFINFEDERLSGMDANDLDKILESYREMFDYENPLIYFDEIQNIEGWEKYVRRLADRGFHVWVTGSNAKMLGKEMATTIGGRFVVKPVSTFSFEDYLNYEEFNRNPLTPYNPEEMAALRKKLREYFNWGGFAETFALIEKREWINSLYKKILLGDIVARNGYRNDRAISLLVRKLGESVKQPVTQSRLKNIIQSTGVTISRNTIAEYLESIDEAFLTFKVTNYLHSLSEREVESKRYFSDNGLLNNLLTDGNTSLLENIVAITLRRRLGGESDGLFYYRNGIEVDFFIPEQKRAFQVAYSVDNEQTLAREAKALVKLSEIFEVEELTIVTYEDLKREICFDGRKIRITNLLEFL